jgi:hypothetical protein
MVKTTHSATQYHILEHLYLQKECYNNLVMLSCCPQFILFYVCQHTELAVTLIITMFRS